MDKEKNPVPARTGYARDTGRTLKNDRIIAHLQKNYACKTKLNIH